jgi:SAM-dependent methyltransferase
MQTIDYNAWAATYDATRRASPSLVDALLQVLGPARDRLLLDIGGGTGNVALPLAQAGFRLALCDRAPSMLHRAASKLPTQVLLTAALAEHLPYQNASFDCAICINVVRHLTDRHAAFAEARRVLRAGPLLIRTTTQETERAHWAHAYFPTLANHQPPAQPERELAGDLERAGFDRVALRRFHYQGDGDGSFQALKYNPHALLDSAVTGNLAVFKRLPAAELAHGLQRLRGDLASGRLPEVIAQYQPALVEYGDGVIVTAYGDASGACR